MSELPRKIMEMYSKAIGSLCQLEDETPDPAILKAREEAAPLTNVDLGGVMGVQPQPAKRQEFETLRLPMIFKETMKGSAIALYHAVRQPYRLSVEEEDFHFLLNQTYFGRLIVERDGEEASIDLTHHGALETLPGFYSHGLKAFLKKSGNEYSVARIEVDGRPIGPDHKNWLLAKMFLNMAIHNEMLFIDHSVIHLNNNYIEAAIRTELSARNPLRLFLEPHLGHCIPLDEMLLGLFYKHTSPVNPFGLRIKSIMGLIAKGLADDRARGLTPRFVGTPFNDAMDVAHRVFYEHASEFVDRNLRVDSPEFDEIRRFSEHVRATIPYFPSAEAIDLPAVKTIAARFLFECCCVSSSDHIIAKGEVGYFRSIFRIRRPFDENASWKPQELFRPIDAFQRIVFRNVFGSDNCTSLLKDVAYDPTLRLALDRFKQRVGELETAYPKLFPLKKVPASIDI